MTMTFLSRITALRHGGATLRYHGKGQARPQTVAEHSFHTALLALTLWGDGASVALLRWCLTHDLAEHRVGDVPSPIKAVSPTLTAELRRLEQLLERAMGVAQYTTLPTPEDQHRARVVDTLECVLYAGEQVRRGGNRADWVPVMVLAWRWLRDMPNVGVLLSEEIVAELDDYVAATRAPVWRCDRCGEFAYLRLDPDTGLRWCVDCRGHDIGTIMATRVAREHVVGNDDPHDLPTTVRWLPVRARHTQYAANGMLLAREGEPAWIDADDPTEDYVLTKFLHGIPQTRLTRRDGWRPEGE